MVQYTSPESYVSTYSIHDTDRSSSHVDRVIRVTDMLYLSEYGQFFRHCLRKRLVKGCLIFIYINPIKYFKSPNKDREYRRRRKVLGVVEWVKVSGVIGLSPSILTFSTKSEIGVRVR